jgi:FlaA1/EpsC-like NDP-sugar epimerase
MKNSKNPLELNENEESKVYFSKTQFLKLLIDSGVIIFAFSLSFLIRFDFTIPDNFWIHYQRTMPVTLVLSVIFLLFFQVFQRRWRYTSISDILNILLAITLAWVFFVLYLHFFYLFLLPKSILAMYWMLSIILLGTIRLIPRFYITLKNANFSAKKRVLIIGAGSAGEMIVRQMKNDPDILYHPVAFIDDLPSKWNTKIHGVKVYGSINNLNKTINRKRIEEIIIAAPSANTAEMRKIVEACENSNIDFKTIPGPKELINGAVITQIRDVKVEDLLERQPVQINIEQMQHFFKDKVVLVTGAAGSIGSELTHQLIKLDISKLICVDRHENGMFFLRQDLDSLNTNQIDFNICLADIHQEDKINRIFDKYRPNIVFHAAAYKHVPLMEEHPEEAIRNNVIGTYKTMLVAEKYNVEKFILISSDKAVAPSSVMGATKRMAELILQSYSVYSKTKLVTVRFGNVLNSMGSVIPLFRKQIANDGPITITHPDMKRFFMTIPEAVKLILESSLMGSGNEIFILDMGEPVRLIDIAKRLIRLSGKNNKDITIKYTGIRPGEKLEEELWNEGETPQRTSHKKIMAAKGTHINKWDQMKKHIEELESYAIQGQRKEICKKLKDIIPNFDHTIIKNN